MTAGRPTKYSDDYIRIAFEVMSLGATITKLAKVFNVNADSIYEWQKKYPEFSESVQRGRDHFDSEQVEEALHKRATGYQYKIKTYIAVGQENLFLVKVVEKYMPPSVNAIRFWLSNRNPERWGLRNSNTDDMKIFYSKAEIDEMLKDEKERYPQLIK